jgi:hypothetical protein
MNEAFQSHFTGRLLIPLLRRSQNSVTHCHCHSTSSYNSLFLHSRSTDPTENSLYYCGYVFTLSLHSNSRGADPIENSLTIVQVVYRAVAWQRVDQIRYDIYPPTLSRDTLPKKFPLQYFVPVYGLRHVTYISSIV